MSPKALVGTPTAMSDGANISDCLAAQNAVLAIHVGSNDDRADVNEAMAAIARLMLRRQAPSLPAPSVLPASPIATQQDDKQPLYAAPQPSADPNRFVGVSLSELCVGVLKEQRKVLRAADIVRELRAKGYEFDSVDPPRSVAAALERRAPNDSEVVKCDRGRWAWSGIYDENELRAIRHSQRTKEGMARSKKRGGRFGPAPKLNDKQMAILLEMARNNESTPKICEMFNISHKTFYNYLEANGISKLEIIRERKKARSDGESNEDHRIVQLHPRSNETAG